MDPTPITIYLNERPVHVEKGCSLHVVHSKFCPEADLLIVNGYPASSETILSDQDRVVMIRRGIVPSSDELETLMMARHTPGVHEKVKKARVGIAGGGGLGSAVAVALARTGVGFIRIVDFDLVEPSNLNRQQYFVDQIGMPKVQALRDNLERINPSVTVDSHHTRITSENLPLLFKDVDILVEAFDAADQKAMLANTFLQHLADKYLVGASGMAGYVVSNTIYTKKITERFYLCGDLVTSAGPGKGLMAPRVGIAAHHQANAVLRLILGKDPVMEDE